MSYDRWKAPPRKELVGKSGIYIITNSVSSLFYIGKSKDLANRAMSHKTAIKNGRNSKRMQEFHDTNPDAIFEYKIIEFCPINHLVDYEEFWIEATDATNPEIGFNQMSIAAGVVAHSEETKQIQREIKLEYYKNNPSPLKGRESPSRGVKREPRTEKEKKNLRDKFYERWESKTLEKKDEWVESRKNPIIQYDLQGDFIAEFRSIREAERITGIQRASISRNLHGKFNHARGFIFRYKTENSNLEKIEISHPIVYREKIRHRINLVDISGNILRTFENITQACLELSLSINCVRKVCEGKRKATKGFIFRYAFDNES